MRGDAVRLAAQCGLTGRSGAYLRVRVLGALIVLLTLGAGCVSDTNQVPFSHESLNVSQPAAQLATHAGLDDSGDSADTSAAASGTRLSLLRGRRTVEKVALTTDQATSVEEVLDKGFRLAGVSPVHLAIRGTPAAGSVRCAWRGVTRTLDQRADAIRFWLRLGPDAAIPNSDYLGVLFTAVLDSLDPEYRETAKANFLAIARGGESMDTCF